MESHRYRWMLGLVSAISAVAWMGLIFFFSSLSGEASSRPLESEAVSWLGEWRSYAGHIVLYAVLAALLQTTLWGWNRGPDIRWVLSVALFSSIFGISDEYHQSFVDGRSATVADAVVDSVAATLSAAFLWIILPTQPIQDDG